MSLVSVQSVSCECHVSVQIRNSERPLQCRGKQEVFVLFSPGILTALFNGPLKLERLLWGGDPIPMPAGQYVDRICVCVGTSEARSHT